MATAPPSCPVSWLPRDLSILPPRCASRRPPNALSAVPHVHAPWYVHGPGRDAPANRPEGQHEPDGAVKSRCSPKWDCPLADLVLVHHRQLSRAHRRECSEVLERHDRRHEIGCCAVHLHFVRLHLFCDAVEQLVDFLDVINSMSASGGK